MDVDWTAANHLLRLVIAMVLAGALGWEREREDRPAGLRTHMMVGASAAMFFILAELLVERYGQVSSVRWDPTRTLQAVVAGIAFLGAGTIFVDRGGSRMPVGLTTAAGLLATYRSGKRSSPSRLRLVEVSADRLVPYIHIPVA